MDVRPLSWGQRETLEAYYSRFPQGDPAWKRFATLMFRLLASLRRTPGGTVFCETPPAPLGQNDEDAGESQIAFNHDDGIRNYGTVRVSARANGYHFSCNSDLPGVRTYPGATLLWFADDPDRIAQVIQAAFGWTEEAETTLRSVWDEAQQQWLARPPLNTLPPSLPWPGGFNRRWWLALAVYLGTMTPHLNCPVSSSVAAFLNRHDWEFDVLTNPVEKELAPLFQSRCPAEESCLAHTIVRSLVLHTRGSCTELEVNSKIHHANWANWHTLRRNAENACDSLKYDLRSIPALYGDLLDNPFRPSSSDPAWLRQNGGTVVQLAQGIYNSRDLERGILDAERFPILADTLEEAGCDDPAILTHCREKRVHVRGCWVIDLLLGKE